MAIHNICKQFPKYKFPHNKGGYDIFSRQHLRLRIQHANLFSKGDNNISSSMVNMQTVKRFSLNEKITSICLSQGLLSLKNFNKDQGHIATLGLCEYFTFYNHQEDPSSCLYIQYILKINLKQYS
jgi:hypothetical protein